MGSCVDIRLVKSVRDNLAETYMTLGTASPGVRESRTDERWMCRSEIKHPVGNFAARFHLTPEGIRELTAIGRRDHWFRIYVCDGDEPESLVDDFCAMGADVRYELVVSAVDSDVHGSQAGPLTLVEEDSHMSQAFDLIVQSFFTPAEIWVRQHMKRALRHSLTQGHEFWSAYDSRGATAAATLVTAAGVIGLYNLCVRPDLRNRGLGSEIVQQMIGEARKRGKTLMLQCEPGLVGWYRRLGMVPIARTRALAFETR